MEYSKLISGSDVRGYALSDDNISPPLDENAVYRIGYAFAKSFDMESPRVSIGRDSRVTGEKLLNACAQGMIDGGALVEDFGLCTTPAMFMSTILQPRKNGAVMVTASHLPYNMNGLKFFNAKSGLSAEQVRELLRVAGDMEQEYSGVKQPIPFRYFLRTYVDYLRDKMREFTGEEQPLTGLRIIVDAGNGAGGFYADMLDSLGADTTGSLFLEPDGMFPNHMPNPENADALRAITEAVRKNEANIGIVFDTDCDRVALVDEDGKPFAGNRLVALVSAIMLREYPGATIVTDSVTSTALAEFIEGKGGKQRRFRRGYKNVIGEALRLNAEGVECPLAIETSGHAALRENYFLDDGAYLAMRLLCEAVALRKTGCDLRDLTRDLREPIEVVSIRIPIIDEDYRATGNAVLDALIDYALVHDDAYVIADNVEGVRIQFSKGNEEDSSWLLMRLSLHEPNMPVQIESDVPGVAREILSEFYDFLKKCPGLALDGVKDLLASRGIPT